MLCKQNYRIFLYCYIVLYIAKFRTKGPNVHKTTIICLNRVSRSVDMCVVVYGFRIVVTCHNIT